MPDWANNWLTPYWLLSVGALAGLLVLLLFWLVTVVLGAVAPGAARLGREAPRIVQEGVLAPILATAAVLAVFGVVGFFLLRDPGKILHSLTRLGTVGPHEFSYVVDSTPKDVLGEPDPAQETAIEIDFIRDELASIDIESSQNVLVYSQPFVEGEQRRGFDVAALTPFAFKSTTQNITDFPEGQVSNLYVVNRGSEAAELTVVVTTRPTHPEVRLIIYTAICLFAVTLLYFLQAMLAPRLSAVALSTYKSEVAQPLFAILLGLGMTLLFIFLIVPYHTLGEDIKMLKDNGLTLIMVLAMVQAVWAAGTSVSEEVEGRTALTVLSKPITRRAFIGGKFLGIIWTVLLLFVVLGLWFLLMVAYKPIYDSRENSEAQPTSSMLPDYEFDQPWQVCHQENGGYDPRSHVVILGDGGDGLPGGGDLHPAAAAGQHGDLPVDLHPGASDASPCPAVRGLRRVRGGDLHCAPDRHGVSQPGVVQRFASGRGRRVRALDLSRLRIALLSRSTA